MKTPFRLDEHPRRPQPLAPPPDGYFDRLPRRVMQRVQPSVAPAAGPGWLAALAAPLRTALAASVVLGGFAATLLLSQPVGQPGQSRPRASSTLAQVPRTELVEYLLASEQRVTLSDLAELPLTDRALPESYLHASPAEVQELLDAQPTDDMYL